VTRARIRNRGPAPAVTDAKAQHRGSARRGRGQQGSGGAAATPGRGRPQKLPPRRDGGRRGAAGGPSVCCEGGAGAVARVLREPLARTQAHARAAHHMSFGAAITATRGPSRRTSSLRGGTAAAEGVGGGGATRGGQSRRAGPRAPAGLGWRALNPRVAGSLGHVNLHLMMHRLRRPQLDNPDSGGQKQIELGTAYGKKINDKQRHDTAPRAHCKGKVQRSWPHHCPGAATPRRDTSVGRAGATAPTHQSGGRLNRAATR
jgi:hypothetical protein